MLKALVGFLFGLSLSSFVCGEESSDNGVLINVNLQSSWITPPYQLELLEAIAAENSTAYFPLLTAIIGIEELEGRLSDEKLHAALIQHATEASFVTGEQVPYLEFSLAVHRYAAQIQAYYQYFESVVSPELEGHENCDNVFYYNGNYRCDIDSVFALETLKPGSSSEIDLLPTDRVLGQALDSPVSILYGDIESESFPSFHSHLVSSALAGKIQYVFRPKPSFASKRDKLNLSGYGVDLALKRTDYLVIDDRNEDKEKSSEFKAQDHYAAVNKTDLPGLGLKAAGYIMKNKEPFEALKKVSFDFPKHSKKLSEFPVDKTTRKNVQANHENGILAPGQNVVLVNGALAFPLEDNVFTMMEVIDRERKIVDNLASLVGDRAIASELINKNLVGENSDRGVSKYDYRTEGLIWLNDIEKDAPYKNFPSDVELFLEQKYKEQLFPIRHNANSVVMAIDLSNTADVEKLSRYWQVTNKGLPIQLGLIPLVSSEKGKEMARQLHYLDRNLGYDSVVAYIALLITGYDSEQAFKGGLDPVGSIEYLTGRTKVSPNPKVPDIKSDEDINQILKEIAQWSARFEAETTSYLAFVNGQIMTVTSNWLNDMRAVLVSDMELIEAIVKDMKPGLSIRDHFILDKPTCRNTVVHPMDRGSIRYMDTSSLYNSLGPLLEDVTSVKINGDVADAYSTLWLLGDFADPKTLKQIISALEFLGSNVESGRNIKLNIVPIIDDTVKARSTLDKKRQTVSSVIQTIPNLKAKDEFQKVAELLNVLYDYVFGDKQGLEMAEVDVKIVEAAGYDQSFNSLKSDATFNSDLSAQVSNIFSIKYPGLVKHVKLIADGRFLNLSRTLNSEDLQNLVDNEIITRVEPIISELKERGPPVTKEFDLFEYFDRVVSKYTKSYYMDGVNDFFMSQYRISTNDWTGSNYTIDIGAKNAPLRVVAAINPLSDRGQEYIPYLEALSKLPSVHVKIYLNPSLKITDVPLKRFYRASMPTVPNFNETTGMRTNDIVTFEDINKDTLFVMGVHVPSSWIVNPAKSVEDLDNIILDKVKGNALEATYELKNILLEGHARDVTDARKSARGIALDLGTEQVPEMNDTIIMGNMGYFQFQANPGYWSLNLKLGRSSDIFDTVSSGLGGFEASDDHSNKIWMTKMIGTTIFPRFSRKKGMENQDVLQADEGGFLKRTWSKLLTGDKSENDNDSADVNIFTVASGHLYERFLSIMTASVMKHSKHTVKFWLIENFLSPSFKEFLPYLAEHYGFKYELVTYKWPHWLRTQEEKQRTIWGYKILFLDVLFPQSLDKVIFVDADQIVRTDLKELIDMDLDGAPYGYAPMCDSRAEIEGFRFWKQGFWEEFLGSEYKYHISALYVVDLKRFRELEAGDRLRTHYQALSADPGSLSNLDQDLPNHMQKQIPIFSLPQDWLWCETWCSDESLKSAKTIDLCNNPMTKEPKLDRARRQIPEWTTYDQAIADLATEFEEIKEKKMIISHTQPEQQVFVVEEEDEVNHEEL